MLIYLILINAAAFLFMLTDKRRAVKDLWRIPESTLLGIAVVGGSLGAILGMKLFRHKTKKPAFAIGLPAMLALHIVLAVWFLS